MTAVKAMFETLRVIAPERAQGAFDVYAELGSALEVFLKELDFLHKGRIQYLFKKIQESSTPDVYAMTLYEHVSFLQLKKEGVLNG